MLWLCGTLVLSLLIIIHLEIDFFLTSELLGWLFSAIMPTLLLIGSVLAQDTQSQNSQKKITDRFFYHVIVAISCYYFALLAYTILSLAGQDEGELIKGLYKANVWLSPIQGSVVALYGFIVTVHSPLKRNGFPLYMIALCVSL